MRVQKRESKFGKQPVYWSKPWRKDHKNSCCRKCFGEFCAFFLTGGLENYSGDVTFFFLPYSGLFWHSKESGVDTTLAVKEYFVEKAYVCGYTTFDFQGQDFIVDLNLYRDTSHYGDSINDWMVCRFADGECIVTYNTLDSFNEDLKRNTAITIDKYGPHLNEN